RGVHRVVAAGGPEHRPDRRAGSATRLAPHARPEHHLAGSGEAHPMMLLKSPRSSSRTAASPRPGGQGGVRTAMAPVVAPSIVSADFSRLAEALAIVDAASDWVHCDVMDNQFVPNLTFGPLIVAAVRKLTRATVDVHLMMERPWLMVDEFRRAGADRI